jgi:hypothetical protein
MNAMMAAATAAKPRSRIGNGILGSLLPTYSMLLSFISGLLDGESGFLVGMFLGEKANGGFEL